MNTISIDSINSMISKYNISNNKSQVKTDEINFIDLAVKTDYTDFSIDYSNDEVSTILGNINDYFDNNDNIYINTSIVDYVSEYAKIVNQIKSNSKFDDDTKIQLTKTLDNSFDCFTEKRIKEFASNVCNFFNKSYYMKESYDHENSNLGIKGDKLLDEKNIERNIRNMFLGAKNFYKNNLNGTKEQLDIALQDKFSKTENVEKLSYNDFKCLDKAMNVVNNHNKIPNNVSIFGSTKRNLELMNDAVENLKKDGASSTLINTFTKAAHQNSNNNNRIEIYAKIRYGYEKKLDKLMVDGSNNEIMLKELEKKREKMIKEHNKEMEKLRHDMYKLNMLNISMNQKMGKYDPIENLTKQHNKLLEGLGKEQAKIEGRINDIRKSFKETSELFNKFMKEPSAFIDSYVENSQED